jgi:hypothetical protein
VRARAGLALGALAVAVPFAAAQPVGAAAQAEAQSALTAKVKDRHVRYGRGVVVSGRVASGEQGIPLALEFRPRGGTWSVAASGASATGGAYRLHGRVPRSGEVRVVVPQGAAVRAADAASAPAQSAAQRVTVVAALRTARTRLHVMPGRRALVRGVLGGAGAGERVALQRRAGRVWKTIARARTNRRGAFSLRYTPRGVGSAVVRVRFAGDRDLGGARKRVGRLNIYRRALASWYGPGFYGNQLGCGGRLGYNQLGVAHKSLPCGTKVTLRHGGRTVRVRVIDRGPYVGAREFDLTRATKDRLRFGGTGTVLVSH